MTLSEIQKEHWKWSIEQFGEFDSYDEIMGMMEELGELAHVSLKKKRGSRKCEDYDKQIRDAVGDIAIFLCGYCSTQGIDLELTIQKTWNEVKKRKYKK